MRFKISAIGKNISNNLPTAYYISFGPADSVLKLLSLCSAQIHGLSLSLSTSVDGVSIIGGGGRRSR